MEQEILVFMSDFMRKVVVWGITLTLFSENEKKKMEKKRRKKESKIEHKIEMKKKTPVKRVFL